MTYTLSKQLIKLLQGRYIQEIRFVTILEHVQKINPNKYYKIFFEEIQPTSSLEVEN